MTVLLLHLPFGGPTLMLFISFDALRDLWLKWERDVPTSPRPELAAYVLILLNCAFWITWAFVFRGGYMFWRGGIVLRRADGRPAGRMQCAFRAALVWVPVAVPLCAAVAVAHFEPSLPWLYFGLWGLGALLLLVEVVLALWLPTRSVHDRIAGTYLMPE
jgi:hypothetical protein